VNDGKSVEKSCRNFITEVAGGADFVDAFVSFTSFTVTLLRFDLFVAFLDRFDFFVITSPPWNSPTIYVFRESKAKITATPELCGAAPVSPLTIR
jgi:hypothetical protein